MPQASGAAIKYAWMDHDPAHLDQAPPVINVWYTVYHDYDVRQLLMSVSYDDDEETGADIEVRWTCDGNIYIVAKSVTDNEQVYIYKNKYNMLDPEQLESDTPSDSEPIAYRDKRALDFKVEVRVVSLVGTNAHLHGRALYETLEVS